MSSKARRTALFPEQGSPLRITSWRASRLSCGFTGRSRSVSTPALVGAGNAHIFAVFCDGTAGDVNAAVVELFGDLIVGERLGAVFLFDHFLDQALEGEQRHAAAFRAA